jgi:hypothetical protein
MVDIEIPSLKQYVLGQWGQESQFTRRMVGNLTADLSPAELNWQSGPGIHSLWHHVWHMYLGLDYYVAHAFGITPAWEDGGWQTRIDLSSMQRAFDYPGLAFGYCPRFTIADVPDELVDELKAPEFGNFMAYVDSMLQRTGTILTDATETELFTPFFAYGRWSPRLSSARFGHISRHIGMMESVRGLLRGPGKGTATD